VRRPAVAVSASSVAYLFARDSSNSYWMKSYAPGAGFGGWSPLGGQFQTDPAAAVATDGTIYLVGRDSSNSIWTGRYQPGAGFLGYASSGGQAIGKPSKMRQLTYRFGIHSTPRG